MNFRAAHEFNKFNKDYMKTIYIKARQLQLNLGDFGLLSSGEKLVVVVVVVVVVVYLKSLLLL